VDGCRFGTSDTTLGCGTGQTCCVPN
jgi:hypothetical protein